MRHRTARRRTAPCYAVRRRWSADRSCFGAPYGAQCECHFTHYHDTLWWSNVQLISSLKLKLKLFIASQNYGASPAIWDHSVTCHPTQANVPRLNTHQWAGCWFTYPGGMEGWVDLGYPAVHRLGIELVICGSQVQCPDDFTAEPPLKCMMARYRCLIRQCVLFSLKRTKVESCFSSMWWGAWWKRLLDLDFVVSLRLLGCFLSISSTHSVT